MPGVVVAVALGLQCACGEEDELCAWVALVYESLAGGEFREVHLGVARHLHEFGMAHALKEGELK